MTSTRPAGEALIPSTRTVRAVLAVLVVGGVLGLALLLRPPTLPNERTRTGGAPAAAGPPALAPAPAATPAGVTAPPPAATAAAEPARLHTIASGDTLLAIAEQYATTVDAIRAANPGLSEQALRIGQQITIPPR